MTRWMVKVPEPSAKRLKKDRRLIVEATYACWGGHKYEFPIPEGEDLVMYDFEYEDGPDANEDILDADVYYRTYIEYRNSTGSRKETISVKPHEVEETND